MKPVMKRSLLYISVLVLLCGAWPAAAGTQPEAQFFLSLQDVPLMLGMVELPDQTVVFDKPEGRIVESVASLQAIPEKDIKTYYESALPQLGWQRIADNSFVRQGEILKLHFETYEGEDYLRIMVAPRGGIQAPGP